MEVAEGVDVAMAEAVVVVVTHLGRMGIRWQRQEPH